MLTGTLLIVAVIAFSAFALTFVLARRALKLFVRVALVAVVALSLLVGYVWFRWQSAATARAPAERRQSATPRR